MSLNSLSELEPTRAKLRLLEESYQAAQLDASGTAHTRELELRSLRQLINQLKEEIARFEAHEVLRTEEALVS
ncbi:MAG: hypothetical protein IAG10_00235 [Planctomycetaceae bacterium]|nr:hypothetical protein [Planctomycetaceae bacterium]